MANKAYIAIIATLDMYKTLRSVSTQHLIKAMGVSPSLYYHYRKYPEDIRIEHLNRAYKCLNVPIEERRYS